MIYYIILFYIIVQKCHPKNTHMWFFVDFHETKNSTGFKQVTPTLTVGVKQLLFNKKSNNCQPICTCVKICLTDMEQKDIVLPVSALIIEILEKGQRKNVYQRLKCNMSSHELATDKSVHQCD